MMVQWVLPAIGSIFIVLAIYHLAAARRHLHQADDASRITISVRKRLGTIFLLVGAGLLGYFCLAF